MKCLVTGATGFTGAHLARTLTAHGHEVRAIVRPGSKVTTLAASGIEIVEGQITNRSDIGKAVAGCDCVFHIAAVFRTAGHPDSHYMDVNVGSTEKILDAAHAHGCERVVYCSTGGVHGHIEDPPAAEDYRFKPDDIYQRSKVEAEKQVGAAMARGQRAVIFRPGAIYGEGDLRFLKLFKSIARRHFVMIGPGTTRLHMVHVDDLVQGIVKCGTEEAAVGQVFLLAGPEAPTLNEIVSTTARITGVALPRLRIPVAPVHSLAWLCETVCVPLRIDPPLHRRRVGFFTHHREFDISKARRMIGYVPEVSVAEGIERTVRWYRQQAYM